MKRHILAASILGVSACCFSFWASAAEPALAAPSGFQGAGLGMGDQRGRAWAEVAFYKRETDTVVAPTLGLGYRVARKLELEGMLPMSYGNSQFPYDGKTSGFGFGNPYAGVSFVELDGNVRYKVGLGVALPLASRDPMQRYAVNLARPTFGLQDAHLWYSDNMAVVVPGRVEVGDRVVVGADASLSTIIRVREGYQDDVELLVQVAPGLGVYATDELLLGARLPVAWGPTFSGDAAQVALEPYARLQLGPGFVNARLTVNLDEPYGFAFDEGKVWGAHAGGGFTF